MIKNNNFSLVAKSGVSVGNFNDLVARMYDTNEILNYIKTHFLFHWKFSLDLRMWLQRILRYIVTGLLQNYVFQNIFTAKVIVMPCKNL